MRKLQSLLRWNAEAKPSEGSTEGSGQRRGTPVYVDLQAGSEGLEFQPAGSGFQAGKKKKKKKGVAEPAQPDLGELCWWREGLWRGPPPVDCLTAVLRQHKLPDAIYDIIECLLVLPVGYSGACVLCHLGLQIAPERLYQTAEEARQNAALMAILLLDGAIGADTPELVGVARPGTLPRVCAAAIAPSQETLQLAQDSLEQQAALLKHQQEELAEWYTATAEALQTGLEEVGELSRQLKAGDQEARAVLLRLNGVESEEPSHVLALREVSAPQGANAGPPEVSMGPTASFPSSTMGLPSQPSPLVTHGPHTDPLWPGESPRKKLKQDYSQGAAVTVVAQPVPTPKNAIMELKEHCDKERWEQPVYEFASVDSGHVARVSVPQGGVENLESAPAKSLKAAKADVAAKAMMAILASTGAAAAAAAPAATLKPTGLNGGLVKQ